MRNRYSLMHRVIPRALFLMITGALLLSADLMASSPVDLTVLDRCPVPKITGIRNVTDAQAEISWHASDSVAMVDLEWREAGSSDWNAVGVTMSPYVLTGLSACLDYDVRMVGHCDGMDSEASAISMFTADGCCRIPTGLFLVSSAEASAVIAWDSVSFAFAHHVRYKEQDDSLWIEFRVNKNLAALQELRACTVYEVQVGSQCDLDSTEYSSSFLFQTGSCGTCSTLTYCDVSADDASAEWIDSISINQLRLRSGSNQGYFLRNTVTTGLERKRPYTFHVSPGSIFNDAQFYLRMWIDLNQDGIFTDSTELLVDPVDPVTLSGWTQTITIPDSIPLGTTRMRVALEAIVGQDTIKPSACEDFIFGEIEDYCISIEDLCPEIVPVLEIVTETSALISWAGVDEAIVFVYQYRDKDGGSFSEEELTQDSLILIDGLEKCHTYVFRTLSVCVQDTSSWVEFEFDTGCPNAVGELIPLASHFIAYPNPFSDHLTISITPLISGPVQMRMFDLLGHEIYARQIFLTKDLDIQTELTGLSALRHGIYLLLLESEGRSQLLKLVK